MSETTLAIIAFSKLIWACCFAFLYSLGGTEGYAKWIRRYVGSFWMGLGVFVFGHWQHSFHWWYLFYPCLLCAALHIGYGGTDDTLLKIRKRVLYGLALGISATPLLFPNNLYGLFSGHVVLSAVSSVFFGVWNPAGNSRSEESLIAFLSTVIPLFLI